MIHQRYLLHIFLLCVLCGHTKSQQNEGDACADQYTNSAGQCTPVEQCRSAKIDFQQNGIKPTFCAYSTFGSALVCCRDGRTILEAATPKTANPGPISRSSGSKRVSERKCEEYSRGVVEMKSFISLLQDPEKQSLSVAKCDYTGVGLIVGGENANRGEFPHMAALGWTDFEGGYTFNCGGSLISPRFVLTAGHCSRDPNAQDPEPVVVRLGDQNIDTSVRDGADPIDVPIRKIHQHPEYFPPRKYNDIALVELATDVQFRKSVRPACLWTRADLSGHNTALATGWGVTDTSTQQTSKELQKVSLSLLDNDYCDRLLNSIRNWNGFAPTQICAGEIQGGKDTCRGDSGSPLQVVSNENQCIFHVVGVTSFGRGCAERGSPAVYTRVSSFVDWIEQIVWPGE